MATFYAIEATDVMGYRRMWSDSYPNALAACTAAKLYSREHPAYNVRVLREAPRPPGHQFGARWQLFRSIKEFNPL